MTQQQLDDLCEANLRKYELDKNGLTRLEEDLRRGKAVVLPASPRYLRPDELERSLKPGQIPVAPWRADLTALAYYGYSVDEIAAAEGRMDKLAAERLATMMCTAYL
jgi:hypothetical protein